MEQLNLNFKYGIRRTPSLAEGGELSELVNLTPKNGELVNVKKPTTKDVNHPNNNGKELVAIHKLTTGEENYIYYDHEGFKVYYNNKTSGYSLNGELTDIRIIGNVLVVTTDKNINYLVWKEENSEASYRQLSDIPEIEIGFFLDGHDFAMVEEKDIIDITNDNGYSVVQNESNFTALESLAVRVIDKVESTEKKFCFPFFVRYGIELYDGTIVKHSAPQLMLINTGSSPIAFSDETKTSDGKGTANLKTALRMADLKYRIVTPSWGEWKDLIKGIVIAITPPIYKYNQGARYDYNKDKNIDFVTCEDYSYSSIFNDEFSYILNSTEVKKESWNDVEGDISKGPIWISLKYNLPLFSNEVYKQKFIDASNFHIISHVPREKLIASNTLVDISEINLSNISTYPTLSDDYNSHNSFSASTSFIYNNRLSIANIKETVKPAMMMLSPVDAQNIDNCRIFTYIKDNNKEYVVSSDTAWDSFFKWAFYPHTGAYKMVVYTNKKGVKTKYDIPLTPHPFLNGAYWMEGTYPLEGEVVDSIPNPVANPIIPRPNYIFTSNTDNPFFFPASLQETIGSGIIKKVTTSAKALSEGQFGQFPLYAFCSDGIWALSVDDEGRYATTNPVSRDVCNNEKAIVQIDSAVVFPTDQGLKLLSQSNVETLSLALEGENVDESKFYDEGNPLLVTDTESFVNMLKNCTILYDYANLMLHVYPQECQEKGKHYVYNFSSNEWSSVVSEDSKVKAVVPGYPYSTLQLSNGDLLQYDNSEDNTSVTNGILLTRSVDMDNPLAMKIINDMRLVYKKMSKNTKCSIAIFASNDGYNWRQITSLRKHSWKYYRFRIKTHLTNLEALTGMVALYDIRRNNKIR